MVILRMGVVQKGVRDGHSPQLEVLGERRVFCLLVLCMQILRNRNGILRQDQEEEGRDGCHQSSWIPLRAVRFHHFSKGGNQNGGQGHRLEPTAWVPNHSLCKPGLLPNCPMPQFTPLGVWLTMVPSSLGCYEDQVSKRL